MEFYQLIITHTDRESILAIRDRIYKGDTQASVTLHHITTAPNGRVNSVEFLTPAEQEDFDE